VARLGGDGFVSILADCATVAQAQGLALLQAADHAMYGAKAQGKNHVQIKHIPNPSD
jgi:GGDEF domain-containing protein